MKPSTILVADHDPMQRQLIEMLLAADNYSIIACQTGQEALNYLRTHTPTLVILEAMLPDVNGIDVCGKIKRVTRLHRTPVIVTTSAKRYEVVKDLARAVRADLVLSKPLGDKNLAERVYTLLNPNVVQATDTPSPHSTLIIEQTLDHLGQASEQTFILEEEDIQRRVSTNQVLYRQLERLRTENRQLKELAVKNRREREVLQNQLDALQEEKTKLLAYADTHEHLSKETERLRADLGYLAEENHRLKLNSGERMAAPEQPYQVLVDELKTLRRVSKAQVKQLETLKKHNQKLLESINDAPQRHLQANFGFFGRIFTRIRQE